jgi:hypothetical protein
MDIKKLLIEENVGGYDLWIRAAAGTVSITALALGLVTYPWNWVLAIVAAIGLHSGMTRHCTPYALIGFSTKEKNR